MTKIYLLNDIVIVSAIIVICAIPNSNCVISDRRLCYDPDCNEPVSLARTLIRYNSIEPHILSFPTNTEVVIFSKEAGRRKDLWGAKVHGKRGYIPKTLVREYKTLRSKLEYEVPTEFVEKEIHTTDKLEVDVPSRPNNIPQDVEKSDIQVNSTINESQEVNTVENVETDVNNAISNESKTLKDDKDLKSKTISSDPPPVVEPSDSLEQKYNEQNTENIVDIVQGVAPSYEVIDGTAIPVLNDELPIKPSYSTPILTATATPDEEPILSVHPSLPTTIRPLISSFSNSDSPGIVDDKLKAESNVFAENLTVESKAKKHYSPVEHHLSDSKIDETEIGKETSSETGKKNDIQSSNSLNDDIAASEITQPTQNDIENSPTVINNNENSGDRQIDSSENTVETSSGEDELLPAVEAAGSSTSPVQTDALQTVENIDELKNENVITSINKSGEDVSQRDLNSNEIQQEEAKANAIVPEIVKSNDELEETIQDERELQDSKEQVEYLSEEKVNDASSEVDGLNSGEEIGEIPPNNQVVEQHGNQPILSETVADQSENFTVHDVADEEMEPEIEVDSESNSNEGIFGSYSPFNTLNPRSEEVTTEIYPSSEEEKLTTARTLLNVEEDEFQNDDNQSSIEKLAVNEPDSSETLLSQEYENETYVEADVAVEAPELEAVIQSTDSTSFIGNSNPQVAPSESCDINSDCASIDNNESSPNEEQIAEEQKVEDEDEDEDEDEESYSPGFNRHNYLEILLYLSITGLTTLLFSLGFYYIENLRRDKALVAKINVLEKELLVTTKENMMLNDGLKATKHKLDSIEDESFGSNEMVSSLKMELEAAQITKGELEDQIITLEKELESATEAGLELERMLREFLASQSDENPLAQSVEDLQTRLNAQQATNESLTNSLNLKSQENEALTTELAVAQEKCQQLEVEVTRLSGELKIQGNFRNNAEKELSGKITQLSEQINRLAEERAGLIAQLTSNKMALSDLSEVLKQQNIDNFDLEKLYNVSHIKAESQLVTKERDELKMKLTEVEGAHELLEEHMKLIREEIASVTEQYELAERDKIEAQTRLEVLSNYFKEKESQLQKELGMQEALWVQKQGEVTSTVDRIQTMQNEIQNYRQQIETLKREILDQEREYKSQISALETKSHEQWVIARQSERRLEESKAEASQLRNRLTLVEKSINEVDTDAKIHRLETNGETAASPQLFMGAETSSSPIIFTGSSGVPPLPPSYMYGGPLPPPFIPPPPHSGGGPMYDISRRPPPLGGRISSPPPIPPLHHPPGRYDDASSPPPLSPPLHPPYNHRSPPPPFSNERIHPHPPPPFLPPLGTSHSWGDEPLPPLRNPVFHPHQQREQQRMRNHKGSLHSSGDSLDKTHHTGKS